MISLETNELIYLYRESQNLVALNIIVERFFNKLYYTIIKKYNSTYYNLPFEVDDFYSLTYEKLLFSIEAFNYLQKNYKFEQYCFVTIKTFIFKEVKKYLRPSHLCLNQAFSYSNVYLDNELTIADFTPNNDVARNIENENLLEKFYHFLSSIKNETAKEILKLRFEGWKNKEIALKLNLKPKKVANIFYSVFAKCKKNIV